MTIHRLNRLARANAIGAFAAAWLEDRAKMHKLSTRLKYPELISVLQSTYALKAVEERLKS